MGVGAVSTGRLDRRRLALVADRFGSSHDGERLAALEAAGRILAAGGATWRDLIGLGDDDDQKSDHRFDADDGETGEAPHHRVVRDLQQRGGACLTTWERNFLRGLLGFDTLSTKQRGILDGIRRKVGVAA